MILSSADSDRFFRLYWGLNAYVNRQLKVTPRQFTAATFRQIPIEQLIKVRDAFVAHPELLERYLEEDPDHLSPEDRALVAGWRLKVAGDFLIVRHLKKFSVFLDERPPGHLYGVVGLQSAVREILQQSPPVHVTAVLLPFLGKIVTDGLLRSSPVHFGRNIRDSINQSYQRIKSREGIRESLDKAEPDEKGRLIRKPVRDFSGEVDDIAARTQRMRAAGEPQQRAALTLLRASAELASAIFHSNENSQPHAADELHVRLRTLRRAVTRIEQTLSEDPAQDCLF